MYRTCARGPRPQTRGCSLRTRTDRRGSTGHYLSCRSSCRYPPDSALCQSLRSFLLFKSASRTLGGSSLSLLSAASRTPGGSSSARRRLLENLVRDVHVGVDARYVIQVFEAFDQSQYGRRLVIRQVDLCLGYHRDLGMSDHRPCCFQSAPHGLDLSRVGQYLDVRSIDAEV